MVTRLRRSVIRSEDELVEWIAMGGNVGLALHFNKPGAPANPLRIVAFDDDDGTARGWLAERGTVSPWIVMGKRGCHVYALLPDDVPDLFTKYNALKPNTPKLDVKTSGLMVLPMDNSKHLVIDGQEVTLGTISLLDRFNSLEGLRSWLPQVDPRTVIPGMRECDHDDPVVLDVSADHGHEDADEGPNTLRPEKRKEPPVSLYLSAVQPLEGSYHPNYLGFPYHERKRHACSHAENALPSIPGKDPWGKLVKVVNDCIHHYGMSDKTTWEIVRDRFNPRCRHGDGRPFPWRKAAVVKTIKWAHEPGSYSTMTNLEKLADPVKVLARLKKKGARANARRKTKTDARRRQMEALMAGALHDLEYVSVSAETDAVFPRPLLYEGAVVFHDLHEEVCALLTDHGEEPPSPKALGAWLGSLGLETYKGRIQRRSARDRNLRPAA